MGSRLPLVLVPGCFALMIAIAVAVVFMDRSQALSDEAARRRVQGTADIGLVVVVGESPLPANFELPANSAYKFTYDAGRIALWDSVDMINPIPPDVEFTSAAGPLLGDFDGNGVVDLLDFNTITDSFGRCDPEPEYDPITDLDGDGCVNWLDYQSWFGYSQTPTVALTVYVEGLTESAAEGDVLITLLVDPDGNTVFTVAGTQVVTVVSINIPSPMGTLGSPVAITLSPGFALLSFDSSTTATWTGVYQPVVGSPTAPFQLVYDAEQFRESSPTQAVILLGEGAISNAPIVEDFIDFGTLVGTLSMELPGGTAQKDLTVQVQSDEAVGFYYTDDFDGPNGPSEPYLLAKADQLGVLALSRTSAPQNPDQEDLLLAHGSHIAAVVQIAENASTAADAPASILVDLISYDDAGTEVDRVNGLTLHKVAGEDGDPDYITYHNDLAVPIVLVDVDLNSSSYPDVIPLQVPEDGTAVIILDLPE